MSDIGICEYCKYKDKDMVQNPCIGCSAQMGAFEFDLSEHDKQIKAEVICEVIEMLYNNHGYSPNCTIVNDIRQLKEKK